MCIENKKLLILCTWDVYSTLCVKIFFHFGQHCAFYICCVQSGQLKCASHSKSLGYIWRLEHLFLLNVCRTHFT